jgi:hypothetical protein
MQKLFLLLFAYLISISTYAQKEIELESALYHIGDSVKVSGWITGVQFLADKNVPASFLKLTANKPNQHLIVLLMGDYDSQFAITKKKALNKQISVKGIVRLVSGSPMIVVHNKEQITPFFKPYTSPIIYKN